MARLKDSKIESALRRIVREAVAAKEDVTVKTARSRVETNLGLDTGFFKNDEQWKEKSKDIIKAAFEESEGEGEAPSTSKKSPAKSKEPAAAKESKQVDKDNSKPQEKNDKSSESTSEEEDSESGSSSDEEESENDKTEKVTQTTPKPKQRENSSPRVNGVKRKAGEQTSTGEDAESDSDSSEESSSESKDRGAKKAKKDSSSSSDVDSSSEDESESAEDKKDGKDTAPPDSNDATAKSATHAIPPKTFKPPPGFTATDLTQLSNKNTNFTSKNLEGKQIWHITAPSSLHLSSITEIASNAIHSNTPIHTEDGIDYVLNADPTPSSENTAMLVPTAEGYVRVPKGVERTLHLQQKITLPNLSGRQASQATGSSAAADVAQAPVSGVRPQPKGLKMRFRPPGFGRGAAGRIGSGSDESSDEEEVAVKPEVQFPRALGAHGASTTMGEGDVTMVDATASAEDAGKEKKKKKKRREKHEATSPAQADLPNGTPAETPSKADEKAKRKEEKRLKKERKEAKRKGS